MFLRQIGQKLKIPTTSRTINASGMLVMPGGIDPHVHLKLPTLNINSVDDFYAGTKAALSGGTTMIIDSVTPAKNESLIAAYERYRSWADPNVACDYGLSMVVREFDDRVKLEMSQVVQNKGVNSFKFYMAYVGDLQVTDRQLYQGFLQCKDCGALARVHAEVGDLIHEKQKELISQGITGPEGHIQSRPEEYQTEATSRACLLAKEANCPLYIVHVMSKGAADAIGNARKIVGYTACSFLSFFLILCTMVFGEAVGSGLSGVNGSKIFDPMFRTAAAHVMSPPISLDGSTSKYLMDSLAAGQLHTTASDHAVFDSRQKALGKNDFTKIPNGVNGVEERMMLVWDKGVNTGIIDPMRFVAITSANAAKLFNLYPKKGRIALNSDADIVIWNPREKKTFSAFSHQSNSDFNIFDGITVMGSPYVTISRGRIVFADNKVLNLVIACFL
uniref:dihydropyrimidinase n=1 Tax=Romanomermis culicivorax TaxID=13658 RepID=A0A915IGI5_ROMCU